ncbi:MAG: hypothetical protein JWR26_4987, partial [Pedosphaera sp.]|nr:hypothetical protein [Pedosphaera sp.]
HRVLETNAWDLVTEVLTPAQRLELRNGIEHWRQQNPHLRNVGAARSSDFMDRVLTPLRESGRGSPLGLLDVVGLDPLSRLDPAVREIERSRYLAERAIYYGERLPKLLSWQAELFVFRMADQPEAKQILSDANRLTGSAEVFAQTAGQLPKLVSDQREAAINQVFDRLASERTNLLADLASEEGKVRDLLAETRATLETGAQMANSVDAAIQSLDAYTRYVTRPKTNAAAVSTNRVPFNVRDYGDAANQIGGMARDLNTLLISANQSAPQAAQLSQQARADANEVLNHAFRLGLLLILILVAALVAGGLLYRVLAHKLTRSHGQKPTPNS